MNLNFLEVLLPMLFKGLKWTMIIAILGILFGFIIGALAGFALQSKNKVARGIANVYIWIVRGIPLMVLAMWIYYVIPKLTGIRLSSETAGIITITLNSGAFISELVRGALAGIDPGQREAGLALGLSNMQTLFHIIVPPAFRTMLPGLFNQFIISVKDTAMLSVIVVNEITKQIQNYAALSFKTIQAYTTGAIFYLVLISILILAQKWIERKMAN
ncbi:MAG: amino acid ABC transporter permease [Lachnospiraceae bacterium]|nr:amino acid ABC transporter permease [Lachnospiraceae bacterium]